MDANKLWQMAAEVQEAQRIAEARGDHEMADRYAHRVSLYTRLAEKRAQ
jgi:hypothetical protein